MSSFCLDISGTHSRSRADNHFRREQPHGLHAQDVTMKHVEFHEDWRLYDPEDTVSHLQPVFKWNDGFRNITEQWKTRVRGCFEKPGNLSAIKTMEQYNNSIQYPILKPGNSFLSSVGDMSLRPLSQTPFMPPIWVPLYCHRAFQWCHSCWGVANRGHAVSLFKMEGITTSTFYGSRGGKWSISCRYHVSVANNQIVSSIWKS